MKRFAILLASTAFVSPALAADVIFDEPPAPAAVVLASPASWTGFYVGVQAGGAFNPDDPDFVDVNTSFPGGVVVNGIPQFENNKHGENDSSFIGGVHAGYDYQFGAIVVGAVVDVNAIDYTEQTGVVSRTADAFYDQTRSVDWVATARLRAGVTVTPSVLAYATGGLAYGDVEYGFNTNSTGFTSASVNDDEDEFGYAVGGGVEVLITENVSFGAEYLYTNLGEGDSYTDLSGGAFSGGTTDGFTRFESNEDLDFHTITAKLSYRFN